MGWNWKNASTALVHLKLLHLDSGVLQSSGSGTGMMVNLISNDVSRFEEFAIVMQPYNNMHIINTIHDDDDDDDKTNVDGDDDDE
jgi:hypothetical protein